MAETGFPLKTDEEIRVLLPMEEDTFFVAARVRWVKSPDTLESLRRQICGIEFERVSDGTREAIASFARAHGDDSIPK